MHLVFAHETWNGYCPSIFLAGPSPRDENHYNWRLPEAVDTLSSLGFEGAVFIPLPRSGKWLDDYDAQVDWELEYLDRATSIAFWMPRDLVHLPAFTSNVEFGLYLRSGKVVLGYPENAVKMRYLHYLSNREGLPVRHVLEETLKLAIQIANSWPAKQRFTE